MIHEIDTSAWNGIERLRSRFRAAGFGLPDAFATIASEACDGAFSAAEFIEENNRETLDYVRGPHPSPRPLRQSRVQQILEKKWQELGIPLVGERIINPIIQAKFIEIEEADIGHNALVSKRAQIRSYAESFGEGSGFQLLKNKRDEILKRVMFKKMPRIGVCGYYINSGGRSSPFPQDVGLIFFLGREKLGKYDVSLRLDDLAWGMRYYEQINGNYQMELGFAPFEPELVSSSAKWGVRAQISFFNLFLETLDEEARVQK